MDHDPGPSSDDAGGTTLLERAPVLEHVGRAAARARAGAPRVVAIVGCRWSGRSAVIAELTSLLGDRFSLEHAPGGPAAGPGPVAVLVDDAERRPADDLHRLADRLDRGEIDLVVLATTPDAAGEGPVRRLLDRPGAEEVALRPLGIASVRTLVARALGRDEPDLAGSVHRRSGGLPALVTPLADDPTAPLPAGAVRRIRAQLADLDDAVREVVELLAVAPGPVPLGVLEAASCQRAVVAARDAGLLHADDGEARLRPPLVGEVVGADLGAPARGSLLRSLARCWIAQPDPVPQAVAALLEAAGDPAAAAGFHLRAAREAAYGDPTGAQAHFADAERTGADLDADDLEQAACAAASAGRPGRAERWARRAEAAHRRAGRPEAARRVWQHPQLAYVRRTPIEGADLDVTSPLRRAADAEAAARRGEPGAAEAAREAAAVARRTADDEALSASGLALLLAGRADESRAVHEELRRRAIDRADAACEAAQLRALSRVALATGDALGAALRARAAVLAAERDPGTVVPAFQRIHLAAVLTLTGDLDEAEAITLGLADHADPTVRAIAGIPAAGMALAKGDPAAALRLLAPLLPHREAAGSDAFSGVLLQVAEAHVLSGDADRARTALDELTEFVGGTLEPTRPDALVLAGRLAADAGDRDGLSAARDAAQAMGQAPGPGVVAVGELLTGLLARLDGDLGAAIEHARAAALAAARAPRPALAVTAWLDVAEAALDLREGDGAAEALAAALRLVEGRGLLALRPRLDAVAARHAAVAGPEVPALTPRERSLLALLAEGATNRQIADRLHLAEKTVRNQLSTLFGKLGVERRAQAAVLAVQLGFHPPDRSVPAPDAAGTDLGRPRRAL